MDSTSSFVKRIPIPEYDFFPVSMYFCFLNVILSVQNELKRLHNKPQTTPPGYWFLLIKNNNVTFSLIHYVFVRFCTRVHKFIV